MNLPTATSLAGVVLADIFVFMYTLTYTYCVVASGLMKRSSNGSTAPKVTSGRRVSTAPLAPPAFQPNDGYDHVGSRCSTNGVLAAKSGSVKDPHVRFNGKSGTAVSNSVDVSKPLHSPMPLVPCGEPQLMVAVPPAPLSQESTGLGLVLVVNVLPSSSLIWYMTRTCWLRASSVVPSLASICVAVFFGQY